MTPRQLADLIDTHAAALVLFARQWCDAPEDAVRDAFCRLAAVRARRPRGLALPRDPQRRDRRRSGGRQRERLIVQKEFRVLRTPLPVSAVELRQIQETLDQFPRFDPEARETPSAYCAKRSADAGGVDAARVRLAAAGHPAAEVARLSALQTVLMGEYALYEIALDDAAKWAGVPFWQLPGSLARQKPQPGPFAGVGSNWYKMIAAKARVQSQVALLSVVEAVRAHAAGHEGTLPATLGEVTLPVPVDPVTGKPFL